MMDAPRRALSGLLLAVLIASMAAAQDVAAINADIKKVEEKLKEEADRVAKKKENLQVEFAALNRPETKSALQAKLAEIGAKHHDAVAGAKGAESRPKVSDALKNAIQEDCKAALAATVGRNLATVLDAQFAANLISGLREPAPINYEALVNDTISIEFTGTDFEANYLKLMPHFEQKRMELEAELAGLKQKLGDRTAAEKAKLLNIPPGMVLVPGGKYRIGMDAKEFEQAKTILRFGPERDIDVYAMGWPPHEVDLQDFYIDINEVTCKYWAEFIKDTGRKPPKNWTIEKKAESRKNGIEPTTRPDETSPPPGMENLPVTMITYDDVELYLAWCGRRLPTEFEWEAAARWRPAGDKSIRMWPWGDNYEILSAKAQCNNATAITHPLRQKGFTLTPVGSFPQGKSALGINDMAGNAMEMTSSFFYPYPKFDDKKALSKKKGNVAFSGSLWVFRGGSALADEMWTLTTTRKATERAASADLLGFRTAASKVRGKDLVDRVAGGHQLAAQLEATGPALKDEKNGRAELAIADPSRFWALTAGGWDPDRQVPARATYLAVVCRNTFEINDAARMKLLAREQKKPLMLGYFRTDIDLKKPVLPKGAYWIMWDPGHTKEQGKNKLAVPEGLVFQPLSNRDQLIETSNVNPVLVNGSTEHTRIDVDKSGNSATMLLCFPLKDRKDGRFIFDIKLEAEGGALKPFK